MHQGKSPPNFVRTLQPRGILHKGELVFSGPHSIAVQHAAINLLQVQQRWEKPLVYACACMKQALQAAGYSQAEQLGFYLRGSLPQGCAVEHVSDIDMSAYVLSKAEGECDGRETVLQGLLRTARSVAIADFPFVTKAGLPPSL